MNSASIIKSRQTNYLEGLALTAIFQACPTMSASYMLMRMFGSAAPGVTEALLFVGTTSMLFALLNAWLGPKFPRFFRGSYAPVFFDPSLTLNEKVSHWVAEPATQKQLWQAVFVLALIGIAVWMYV